MFLPVWGHFITDVIRRAWFFKSEDFKQFKNCPIVCVSESTKIEASCLQMLEILGIDIERFQIIRQPTKFKNIILPDESLYIDGEKKFITKYRETIDCVRNFALKNRTPTSCKKIYSFFGSKHTFGEERLAEYFKSKGYEIVINHKLTLNEELNLFINCENFAATVGSCSHNSMFMRDGTEVILIPRSTAHLAWQKPYQILIDQVFPMNTNYIDSCLSIFAGGNHHFCYVISEQLKRFFGDKWKGYEEDDFKTFLQYVKYYMGRGFVPSSREKRIYGEALENFMTQLKQHESLIMAYNMPLGWETFQPPPAGYQTHVARKGWGEWIDENQISNPLDQKLEILAIRVSFPKYKTYYSVYNNDAEGWLPEVTTGEMAGTVGVNKPIYGLRVRLDEAGTKEFDILYRMHKFDGTWTPWAKNGEALYSNRQKLNAIQIKLEPINIQSDKTQTEEFDDMYTS